MSSEPPSCSLSARTLLMTRDISSNICSAFVVSVHWSLMGVMLMRSRAPLRPHLTDIDTLPLSPIDMFEEMTVYSSFWRNALISEAYGFLAPSSSGWDHPYSSSMKLKPNWSGRISCATSCILLLSCTVMLIVASLYAKAAWPAGVTLIDTLLSDMTGLNLSRMGVPREPTLMSALTSVCGDVKTSMPKVDCSPGVEPAGTRTPKGSFEPRVDVMMS